MVKLIENNEDALMERMKLQEKIQNDPIEDFSEYKEKLKECYEFICSCINYYMDISEEKLNIVALWIIGTYFHESFQTFPYLFINAMRGSGKTRLLRLISFLSKNGQIVNSITDAVLFRTTGTLCLDEFEGIGRKKENESLKELLNSSYKKGVKVMRMKKKKGLDGESQIVEEFQPYRPISMANIWGMEEVLGDRCIITTLEKSSDSVKTKLIENYDSVDILPIKRDLDEYFSVVWCKCSYGKNIHIVWNNYLYDTTHNYITTPTTTNYTKIHSFDINENVFFPKEFFRKIKELEIDGRNLELFFPLFSIANEIGEEILEKTIEFSKSYIEDKKIEEITESKDVMVYTLVANERENEWKDISKLSNIFKFIIGDGENEWVNSKWVGRALKRLNLIKKKRRTSAGIQVILDVDKAKKKEIMFKPKE